MTQSMAEKLIIDRKECVAPLKLISLCGTGELADKITEHLQKWARQGGWDDTSYRIEATCPRFSNGEGKGIIHSSVRGDDLFLLSDVGNYSCTYRMFGRENNMSPDDHYQDLKRVIQAAAGKAYRVNVIMPILYGGRQHRRSHRESLDCAVALQELESMGVANIITFDAHDPRVCNAVPLMGFDSVIPSYQVLKCLFRNVDDIIPDPEHLMIVSPDEGAMNRNMFYASVLGVELGMFYKRRDYSRIENGRHPIVAHEYLGNTVEGKDIFIADDIISSGESMLDVAYELKARKAARIYCYATYPTFTSGLAAFDKAVEEGVITAVLGTNLTYRTEALKKRPWFFEVDVSKYIAYFMAALNHDKSVSMIIDPHQKIEKLLWNYKNRGAK